MKPQIVDLPNRPKGLSFDLKPVADARFDIRMGQSSVEIEMFGVVGLDILDTRMSAALRQAGGKPITLLINSPGGDAFVGISIYNLLARYAAPVTVQITGIAASAASIIAMGANRVEMPRGSQLMIHNAWSIVLGDYRTMTAAAEFLQKVDGGAAGIYSDRTGQPVEVIRRLMDSETFLTADEAVEMGFADAMSDGEAADRPKEKRAADAKTEREFEAVLRDLGFAKAAAARLASGGWRALKDTDETKLEPVAAKMAAILSKLERKNYHVA